MTKGAIVFDLDGTLIDSAPDLQAIANTVTAPFGTAAITLDEAKSFIGKGVAVFVSRLMASRNLGTDADLHASLSAEFASHYRVAVEHSRLYPGVIAALDSLAAAGFRLGLCTNKPMAPTQTVLAHFGLKKYFTAVSAGDSQPEHKPDAAPLLQVFAQLGGSEDTRLYVGDSEVDVETAVNAQTDFALFTEGYRKTPIGELTHRYAFSTFDDFVKISKQHFRQLSPGL